MREKLFSVTSKDCNFIPYRGSGAGGQKRNKTFSAIRCVHEDSGSVGACEGHREQTLNKREAFKRMTSTDKFKIWLRVETNRATGLLLEIEKKVDREMKTVKIEMKDENGRWTNEKELTKE